MRRNTIRRLGFIRSVMLGPIADLLFGLRFLVYGFRFIGVYGSLKSYRELVR
ncbi:hypothetical protein [Larkinella terrae]|uniref:hypothetical protein n=1 Tax=Larkinella terrae TaxID=2025311 RepID=UPI0012AD4EA8|nr:hypothetical protein [Larkinella terrae]